MVEQKGEHGYYHRERTAPYLTNSALPAEFPPSLPHQEIRHSIVVKFCLPLSKNVTADVLITGPEITADNIAMLLRYLELTKEALVD